MIQCECCGKVIGTIQESPTIEVIGEVTLVFICQGCKTVNYYPLYEYNKERMKQKKEGS